MSHFLIYGATGYTGRLIAREAVARGLRPVLAGRTAGALAFEAAELGVEHRIFGLDDPAAVARGLEGVRVVLNCAGPFVWTSRPLVEACLRSGTHYLDITGEIDVFEALAARDAEALAARVTLLPGVGFDVVPSDCLAAHLKRRLPRASRLTLAVRLGSRVSRGTLATMIEQLPRQGMVRQAGVLKRVPAGWKTRLIDFGDGPMPAVTIPWGDVSTAYYSTAIPDVRVYAAASRGAILALRASRGVGWLFRLPPVRRMLHVLTCLRAAGPTAEQRARGRSDIWGDVCDDEGHRAAARLHGPNAYTLTVQTALACAERVLRGEVRPGFLTPAAAFGPDFVLQLPGLSREDEPEPVAVHEAAPVSSKS